jgi:hypothetical protein
MLFNKKKSKSVVGECISFPKKNEEHFHKAMKSVEKDKKKLEDCLDSLEEADGVTIFLPENEKDVTGKIIH